MKSTDLEWGNNQECGLDILSLQSLSDTYIE